MDNPPSVAELAAESGLSLSHFHHAFQEVIGESAKQHMLRLRVERASLMLIHSDWQTGEIGLACGFKTPSSFSRAFKSHFGATPGDFREAHAVKPHLKGPMRRGKKREVKETSSLLPEVRIEQWPALELACLRCVGNAWAVGWSWEAMLKWARQAWSDLEGARFFGIWHDDWTSRRPDLYRYDCAVWHPSGPPPSWPEHLYRRTLPEGLVAVSTVTGGARKMDQAWMDLLRIWLPHSEFQPRLWSITNEYSPSSILGGTARRHFDALLGRLTVDNCLHVQHQNMKI